MNQHKQLIMTLFTCLTLSAGCAIAKVAETTPVKEKSNITKKSLPETKLKPLTKAKQKYWEKELKEACPVRAKLLEVPHKAGKEFCRCLAKNHILLVLDPENAKDGDPEPQLLWVKKGLLGTLKPTEVRADPFAILGPSSFLEGIDNECDANPNFRLDPKNPIINP